MSDPTPNPEPPPTAEQLIREGTAHFQQAMAYRNEMNIRVARRVTSLIRGLLFGAVAIQLIGFFLIRLLTGHMNDLITTVDTMNRQMTSMSGDMAIMRRTVERMERDVQAVTPITTDVGRMREEMERMDGHVAAIDQRLQHVNGNMVQIGQDVGAMSRHLVVMQRNIDHIGGSVHRMSAPMKMFNQMNPLR
ncbi:hypothetical protein [Endothiovibrio diazotrophicus]